jgi:septum formation protein
MSLFTNPREPIILASASPRRQEFFRLLGLPFTCIPAQIDETPLAGLSPRQVAEDLALRKTQATVAKIERGDAGTPSAQWVFGADTIVVLDGAIFGKAADRNEAKTMLERLAGRRHEVMSAMALYNSRLKKAVCRSNTSEVVFAPLSGAEIDWYLDTGEWEGAAGSYRLQDRGACLIESINGSPSAVAGLPLHDFYVMLRDNGYPYGA